MGALVFKDDSTGQSKTYTETKEGYAQFKADVQAAARQGHSVSGDIQRVSEFYRGHLWD